MHEYKYKRVQTNQFGTCARLVCISTRLDSNVHIDLIFVYIWTYSCTNTTVRARLDANVHDSCLIGTAKQLQHPAPKNSGFCRTGPQDDVRAQKSLSGNRMRPALQSRSTAPMLPRFQVRRPPSSLPPAEAYLA